ncbi:efflux RND transporter periplasmic adaptor subunit [Persicirhabdus sediminis]|uniref:Efflux RND transporter periplasmic adaptor subunit n=1 Tax=Persicirhabdus sediminis TaxID=454144 RepID=A0A8J7SK36_9BACT|nr:efflux RND transporter periplasmic adaptor subunit [Persicirhabdus sediminis]MBK1791774.1 efflux RND transporter periplasmic adaptor subunit [Persicirhabdus sediminis]
MDILKKLFSILLIPITILALAAFIANKMIASKPERKKKAPKEIVARTEVIEVEVGPHPVTLASFGTVASYYDTQLSSLVTGEIIDVSANFEAGKSVNKGEILVSLNQADYTSAVAERKSAISTAKRDLAEEVARGKQAKLDWLASGRKIEDAPEYTLRIPQQIAASAELESAEAALARAQLDLERTQIRAPFDAVVSERTASPGSIVTTGTQLGKLIARNKAEVRLPLTPDEVNLIDLPFAFREQATNESIETTLTAPSYPGVSWKAQITRTEASVDANNRVIYVVAEIDRPFDQQNVPLPIGTFVKATAQAKVIDNAILIPESSILDDKYVWQLDDNNQLRRLTITRIHANDDQIIATADTEQKQIRLSARPLVSFNNGQKVMPIKNEKPASHEE